MALLRLFVTIGIAAATGGWALKIEGAATMTAGALMCFAAM